MTEVTEQEFFNFSTAPPHCAIIVFDILQEALEFYARNHPHVSNILQNMMTLIAWARAQGVPVVYCLADLLTYTPNCTKGSEVWNNTTDRALAKAKSGQTSLWTFADYKNPNERIFHREQSQFSALTTNGLEAYLQNKGITEVLLAGFSTSDLVLSTALAMLDKKYTVAIMADACGETDQELHNVLINKVLGTRCYIWNVEQYIESLNLVVSLA